MENDLTPKSLSDLIHNPSELSAIISDPIDAGMKFYNSLHNKDKSYVAYAAGVGLLAFGLYLSKSGSGSSTSGGSGSNSYQSGSNKGKALSGSTLGAGGLSNASASQDDSKSTSNKELDIKKKSK